MEYTIIEVPDLNDSLSRIVLNGTVYHIRFTYNDTKDFWKFGVYTALDEPIAIGIRVVPNFFLNLFTGSEDFPVGGFAALTTLDHIGRYDFRDGVAQFVYFPIDLKRRS